MSPYKKQIINADESKLLQSHTERKDGLYKLFSILRTWFPIWVSWQEILKIGKFEDINLDGLYESGLLDRELIPMGKAKMRATYRISARGLEFIGNLESQKTNDILKDLTLVLIFLTIVQSSFMFLQIILLLFPK